jgi:hypothetical protein
MRWRRRGGQVVLDARARPRSCSAVAVQWRALVGFVSRCTGRGAPLAESKVHAAARVAPRQ